MPRQLSLGEQRSIILKGVLMFLIRNLNLLGTVHMSQENTVRSAPTVLSTQRNLGSPIAALSGKCWGLILI